MPLSRRRFLPVAAAALSMPSIARAGTEGGSALAGLIEAQAADVPRCGPGGAAVRASIERARSTRIPLRGRAIFVNVPSRGLVAYEDGVPALEMQVIPGAPRTPTPDLDTTLHYVRLNPTWTVPASILREPLWRNRIADPRWMARNGFVRANGRIVQQPGPGNALGTIKFGLRNADGIFLHDTNEPEGFSRPGLFASHGCIRLEDPYGLAAWVTGLDVERLEELRKRGDRTDRVDFPPVAVILSYLTAWPGADGSLTVHPDIYRRDPSVTPCPTERSRTPR